MLSSEKSSNAAVKLVDFGSAQVTDDDALDEEDGPGKRSMTTPAYSPPEYLEKKSGVINPSFDM
jgi:serine/threonine protein kinase